MTVPVFSDLHRFDPELSATIGRVITSWSLYETVFTGVLHYLSNSPAVRARYPSGPSQSFKKKTEMLRTAFGLELGEAEPGLREKIDAMCEVALSASELRNAVCHGQWLPTFDQGTSIYHDRGDEVFRYEITTEGLIGLDEAICACHGRVSELVHVAMWSQEPYPFEWLTSQEISALRLLNGRLQNSPKQQERRLQHKPFRT